MTYPARSVSIKHLLCASMVAALLTALPCPSAHADDWYDLPSEFREEEYKSAQPSLARLLNSGQVDLFTISASPIVGFHLGVRLFSYTGDNVRCSLLDMGFHFDLLAGDEEGGPTMPFASHVGTTVALGARSGSAGQFGNWFMTGAWYGSGAQRFDEDSWSYDGLFIPIGWEFTQHLGRDDKMVWGYRAYAAVSPVGVFKHNTKGEEFASLASPDRNDWRATPKAFFGSDFFIGF